MRNFKKIVLLLCIFVVTELILDFALEPVTYQHYLNMELKQKEKEGITPDMILIGNSRVSTSFIPSRMREKLDDVNCIINAGTGSQSIEGTYFYLKDMLRKYEVKYVVVGLDYEEFITEEHILKGNLVVLERINSPFVKTEFILDSFKPSEYIYFLKSYQYKENLIKIPENLNDKLSREYRKGVYVGGGTAYEDLGFARESETFGNSVAITTMPDWSEDKLVPQKLGYLDKIVEICEENGIQLYLVATPLTMPTVAESVGYSQGYEYFKKYADEHGVYYDDLNLMKNRNEILPDSTMNCMEHVGGNGAEVVSDVYCQILNNHMKNKKENDILYTSVEEAVQNMGAIIACNFTTTPEADGKGRLISAVSCRQPYAIPEYQFELEKDGHIQILQSFSSVTECVLKKEDIKFPFMLRLRCHAQGNEETERIYEVMIDEETWK